LGFSSTLLQKGEDEKTERRESEKMKKNIENTSF